MSGTLHRITWADGATSVVSISEGETSDVVVSIAGRRRELAELAQYTLASGARAALVEIVRREGAMQEVIVTGFAAAPKPPTQGPNGDRRSRPAAG